jgi:hypothetical protein
MFYVISYVFGRVIAGCVQAAAFLSATRLKAGFIASPNGGQMTSLSEDDQEKSPTAAEYAVYINDKRGIGLSYRQWEKKYGNQEVLREQGSSNDPNNDASSRDD